MDEDPADVRAFYERYLGRCNEHRMEELGEFVAQGVNGPAEGLERYASGLRAVIDAFPDYRWEFEDLLADRDRIAVRLTGSGTHRGPFRGVPPTGRRVTTQELVVYRIVDGRIAECWGDLGAVVRDELVSGG